MVTDVKKVVRVAVNNNFNCTPKEFGQLDKLQEKYPKYFFFVNSNIRTPRLMDLNDHPYRAVITINPDIYIRNKDVERLSGLHRDRVAFVRVKYMPGFQESVELIQRLSEDGYEVVVTPQRFNGKKGLYKYAPNRDAYKWSHNRYRLTDEAMDELRGIVAAYPNAHICDDKGLGCQGCGLCSTLTSGVLTSLASVNLSTSGLCKYNCPDCYAKTMQKMARDFGYCEMITDKIRANTKQAGRTSHIIETLKKMEAVHA